MAYQFGAELNSQFAIVIINYIMSWTLILNVNAVFDVYWLHMTRKIQLFFIMVINDFVNILKRKIIQKFDFYVLSHFMCNMYIIYSYNWDNYIDWFQVVRISNQAGVGVYNWELASKLEIVSLKLSIDLQNTGSFSFTILTGFIYDKPLLLINYAINVWIIGCDIYVFIIAIVKCYVPLLILLRANLLTWQMKRMNINVNHC